MIVSGASEGGEEALEAALQPFLQKLIYDHDAETILDNPALFWDYAYEALIGGILGMFGGSVNADANTDVNSEADAKTETEQNAQATDSAVQSDDGYGIINKKLPYLETKAENSTELTYTQAELSEIGETMLDMGIIPDKPFLDAMGVDEATARGI